MDRLEGVGELEFRLMWDFAKSARVPKPTKQSRDPRWASRTSAHALQHQPVRMLSASHAYPGVVARSRQVPSCATLLADCCWHSSSHKDRTRRSARWKPVPAAAADLETANDTDWDTKYGGEPLGFGISALQGPRETMEDFASVIPEGRCGFLVACGPSIYPPPFLASPRPFLVMHSDGSRIVVRSGS